MGEPFIKDEIRSFKTLSFLADLCSPNCGTDEHSNLDCCARTGWSQAADCDLPRAKILRGSEYCNSPAGKGRGKHRSQLRSTPSSPNQAWRVKSGGQEPLPRASMIRPLEGIEPQASTRVAIYIQCSPLRLNLVIIQLKGHSAFRYPEKEQQSSDDEKHCLFSGSRIDEPAPHQDSIKTLWEI